MTPETVQQGGMLWTKSNMKGMKRRGGGAQRETLFILGKKDV